MVKKSNHKTQYKNLGKKKDKSNRKTQYKKLGQKNNNKSNRKIQYKKKWPTVTG